MPPYQEAEVLMAQLAGSEEAMAQQRRRRQQQEGQGLLKRRREEDNEEAERQRDCRAPGPAPLQDGTQQQVGADASNGDAEGTGGHTDLTAAPPAGAPRPAAGQPPGDAPDARTLRVAPEQPEKPTLTAEPAPVPFRTAPDATATGATTAHPAATPPPAPEPAPAQPPVTAAEPAAAQPPASPPLPADPATTANPSTAATARARAARRPHAPRATVPTVDLTQLADSSSSDDDEVLIVGEVRRGRPAPLPLRPRTHHRRARPPPPGPAPVIHLLDDGDDVPAAAPDPAANPQRAANPNHDDHDDEDDRIEAALLAFLDRMPEPRQVFIPPAAAGGGGGGRGGGGPGRAWPAAPCAGPAQMQVPAVVGAASATAAQVHPAFQQQLPWPAALGPPPPPSPERGFKCPICLERTTDNSSTVCGHIFCTACITACINVSKKCPNCRKTLTKKQLHKIFLPT